MSDPWTHRSDPSEIEGEAPANSWSVVLAMGQWCIRFAQQPETLPGFTAFVRRIWPDCEYTDVEIAEDMRQAHDGMARLIRSLEGK